eukprot:gene34611-40602_t
MEGEEKQAEEDGGNAMFFRLLGGSSSVASFGAVGSTRGGRRDGIIELSDVVASIKRAIVKGTNLWKSNRRDECYDLYLDTCEEANRNLHSLELRGPLSDSIANGQQQGAMNKQRGAVILRKALDKILVESQQPNVKKAESDHVQQLRDKSASLAQLAVEKEAATGRELQALVEDINGLLSEERSMQAQREKE